MTQTHQVIPAPFAKNIYIIFSDIFNSHIRCENTEVFRQAGKWSACWNSGKRTLFVSIISAKSPSSLLYSQLLSGTIVWNHCQKSLPTWQEGCCLKIYSGIQIPSTHLKQGLLFTSTLSKEGFCFSTGMTNWTHTGLISPAAVDYGESGLLDQICNAVRSVKRCLWFIYYN